MATAYADHATDRYITWPNEKCASCAKKLTAQFQIDPKTGRKRQTWSQDGGIPLLPVDEEIGAAFCIRCHIKWRSSEVPVSDKALEHRNPLVVDVVQALRKRQGILDATPQEHLRRLFGDVNVSEYEASPIWKKRRDAFLQKQVADPQCELCLVRKEWTGREHKPIDVVVHHKTYERAYGCELDDDLAVMCRRCHPVIHRPWEPGARAQFRILVRDRDEADLLDAIAKLLPIWGWG